MIRRWTSSAEIERRLTRNGIHRSAAWHLRRPRSVLPVDLTGHNSRFFYVAGPECIHVFARFFSAGSYCDIVAVPYMLHLGSPLKSEALRIAATPVPATALIREQVERQAHRGHPVRSPIADPIDRALVSREIAALPATATLLTSGVYDVLCADAASIPSTLREIGRLRERTFREVGREPGRPSTWIDSTITISTCSCGTDTRRRSWAPTASERPTGS